MDPKTLNNQIDTVELAFGRKRVGRDPAKVRATRRRYYAKNREKELARAARWRAINQDKVRGYYETDQARAHEAFRQQFETERERERQVHLRIKASQLRRSIIRNGVIVEYAAWDWDMGGMVDQVTDVGHFEFDPAILDFQYWFAP